MTLTIELTPEEESRLAAAAAVAGLDPIGYVRSIIRQAPASVERNQLTGHALVDHLISDGVIGAGFGDPKVDSPEAAQMLRAQVWRKLQLDSEE
jgi:hypothetical protein